MLAAREKVRLAREAIVSRSMHRRAEDEETNAALRLKIDAQKTASTGGKDDS